jgi:hypothetical protein
LLTLGDGWAERGSNPRHLPCKAVTSPGNRRLDRVCPSQPVARGGECRFVTPRLGPPRVLREARRATRAPRTEPLPRLRPGAGAGCRP